MPYRAALEWLDRALAPWPFNLHHITNIAVEIDGDRGESRCYFTAPMARKAAGGGQDVVTNAGYYLDIRPHAPGLADRGAHLRHDRPDRPGAVRLHDPGLNLLRPPRTALSVFHFVK
jgi:hypothetical protein